MAIFTCTTHNSQHLTDYSAKNAENLRSCPSFDEVQHGGVNNYVMHSNGVNLRPRLMGTADNRRTELLRTYPVESIPWRISCWAAHSCGVV